MNYKEDSESLQPAKVCKKKSNFSFKGFAWIISIIGAVIGALCTLMTMGDTTSAPQEAAVAAVGIAWAVIPYCFARAVSEVGKKNNQ